MRWAWPLVMVLAVSIAGVVLWPVLTRLPADLGIQRQARINQLIYPTFGNPAIVRKTAEMTIEFDPRNRVFKKHFVVMRRFNVLASTSNDPYPFNLELPVRSTRIGHSRQWPEYAADKKKDNRIYLITVEVPAALPEDLYDLTVSATDPHGDEVADYQPHSLQAVQEYKDRFSFCQFTDIHVFGSESEYATAVYLQRGDRSDGRDPSRKGAVYYRNAVDQANVIKPDFCVFTGDFMYGQSYFLKDQGAPWGVTTEYEYEQLWFYEETMRLDVPVFLVIGNHESFAEGSEGAGEDWFENWRRLYGPVYHSFDYGEGHFLALNSQDWPASERTLYDYDVSIQSEKYKGQFSGGGDAWSQGVTLERLERIDTSKLTGQLAWMRDDLAAHQSSSIRVVATHQDPWRTQGSGAMWASKGRDSAGLFGAVKGLLGFAGTYGNGAGRLAAIRLMAQYKVALEVSGHYHSDSVETFPWADGTGEVICANTTCTQFNVYGMSNSYPGYRRIWIDGGRVESVNYLDPRWSYPLYEGTNVGGITDMNSLETPAIQTQFIARPGGASAWSFAIANHLTRPLPSAYVKIQAPYLSGGYFYQVVNGRPGQCYDSDAGSDGIPDVRTYQIYTDVGAGESTVVSLVKSDEPDHVAPRGSVSIAGSPVGTGPQRVTLDLAASDAGGSGVKDVMASNSPDFAGAQWQPLAGSIPWTLAEGAPGARTVYVKFRDYAMPPNESPVANSTI